MTTEWQNILKFLNNKTGKPEEYFELLCDYYIVEYCVKGLGNEQISNLLGVDIQSIRDILDKRIGFEGFRENLTFSPILWYNCMGEMNDSRYSDGLLEGIVTKFYEIKEKIEQYECNNSRF